MSGGLFGWPLYGIILAFGQVRHLPIAYSRVVVTTDRFTDVERDQLSNCLALWFKWADQSPAVHRWRDLRRFGCLVPALPFQIFCLGPFPPMVLLRSRFPPYWTPQHQRTSAATYSYSIASAGGFAFFGLNFGEEAGAATEVWILRACIVQGS